MLLSQALEGYEIASLADGFSELTIDAYVSSLGLLVDFLHDPEVGEITEQDLQRFFGYIRTKYQPEHSDTGQLSTASIHRYWKAVRSFFKWANREHYAGRPDAGFKMPRYNNSEIIPYSQDDVQKLLKACEVSKPVRKKDKKAYQFTRHNRERDYAILLTLLDTGLRPGELCRLRIADANLKTGEIQVRPYHIGKTRPRVVIVEKTARNAIWNYLSKREGARPEEPLFLTDEGHEMTRYTLGSLIARLGEKCGISDANPYRFRHTFAIEYLRNGGDVFTLQRILGHSTLEMCRVYLRLAQTDAAKAHQRASPVERWKL